MRYFATSTDVYESVRSGLDDLWGHPKIKNGVVTTTCIEPATTAPHDADGRVLIALRGREENMPEVSPILDQLITNGDVEEITRDQYISAIPQTLPPIP